MKSRARSSLDRLLALYPCFNLVSAEWQLAGPWLLVALGQPSTTADVHAVHHYAIWKRTGAVHAVLHDGSVTEEPLLS